MYKRVYHIQQTKAAEKVDKSFLIIKSIKIIHCLTIKEIGM